MERSARHDFSRCKLSARGRGITTSLTQAIVFASDASISLSNIYWLGGSPCSGKSTIADVLAAAYGMTAYRCDEAYFRHQTLITPERQPVFSRLSRASCDEIWMRPVPRQVDEEIALYREEFPLILADLAAFPTNQPVIAEGAALLPELLESLGFHPRRALWIVPTEEFQKTHYSRRPWRHDVLAACTNQEQAWRNWMARDAGFARVVAEQSRERRYQVLTVDGTRTIQDNARAVEAWFRLLLSDPIRSGS
jgi:hypothetical protein